jgi:hypothetical protein
VTSCNAFDLTIPFDPCPNGDVVFFAEGAGGTHLVVDVAGYFIPATGYGQRESAASDTNITLATTCTNLLSVGITNNSDYDRTVVCTASANNNVNHTNGTQDILVLKIADSATNCGALPIGEAGESIFNVPAAHPTTFYYSNVGLLQTFELDAGTTATYYLNGYTFSGGTTNSAVGQSMTCFIP